MRLRRKNRIRKKVIGTAARPRLSVFRSGKHFSAQLIDDSIQKTLLSASDKDVKMEKSDKLRPVEIAGAVGELLAKRALNAGVTRVVFDRGGFAYHGRIQKFAESARKAGLTF